MSKNLPSQVAGVVDMCNNMSTFAFLGRLGGWLCGWRMLTRPPLSRDTQRSTHSSAEFADASSAFSRACEREREPDGEGGLDASTGPSVAGVVTRSWGAALGVR